MNETLTSPPDPPSNPPTNKKQAGAAPADPDQQSQARAAPKQELQDGPPMSLSTNSKLEVAAPKYHLMKPRPPII